MFKNLTMKEEKNHVVFYNDNNEEIYSINYNQLGSTREEQGIILSEWIDHLTEKTWIKKKHLYELAAIIVKRFPNNLIDWKQVFLSIERNDWIDKEYEKQRSKPIPKGFVHRSLIADKIRDQMEFARNLDYKSITPILQEKVAKQLKEYKILS